MSFVKVDSTLAHTFILKQKPSKLSTKQPTKPRTKRTHKHTDTAIRNESRTHQHHHRHYTTTTTTTTTTPAHSIMSETNHNDNNEEEVRRKTGTEDDDNLEEHQPTMRYVKNDIKERDDQNDVILWCGLCESASRRRPRDTDWRKTCRQLCFASAVQ